MWQKCKLKCNYRAKDFKYIMLIISLSFFLNCLQCNIIITVWRVIDIMSWQRKKCFGPKKDPDGYQSKLRLPDKCYVQNVNFYNATLKGLFCVCTINSFKPCRIITKTQSMIGLQIVIVCNANFDQVDKVHAFQPVIWVVGKWSTVQFCTSARQMYRYNFFYIKKIAYWIGCAFQWSIVYIEFKRSCAIYEISITWYFSNT